jgi:hypothetical protein
MELGRTSPTPYLQLGRRLDSPDPTGEKPQHSQMIRAISASGFSAILKLSFRKMASAAEMALFHLTDAVRRIMNFHRIFPNGESHDRGLLR